MNCEEVSLFAVLKVLRTYFIIQIILEWRESLDKPTTGNVCRICYNTCNKYINQFKALGYCVKGQKVYKQTETRYISLPWTRKQHGSEDPFWASVNRVLHHCLDENGRRTTRVRSHTVSLHCVCRFIDTIRRVHVEYRFEHHRESNPSI